MNKITGIRLLGIYNLILSCGAFFVGILMLQSNYGVFEEFPKEWLTITPFKNWILPGLIMIFLFGLGNLVSVVVCFYGSNNAAWSISVALGMIMLIGVLVQRIVVGEWYMADNYFFLLSTIQISLGLNGFLHNFGNGNSRKGSSKGGMVHE